MSSDYALSDEEFIGLGVYSTAEAARYARANPIKLSRWMYGTSKSEPVFDPQLGRDAEERIVTFLDFAQALSVNEIRRAVGIPLQKIRKAYLQAREEFNVERPFASAHGIFVFGDLDRPDRCELGVYVAKRNASESAKHEYVEHIRRQLTGKKSGNLLINEIVSDFSQQLIFSSSGVATGYAAFESRGIKVMMDPDYRFGKPHIQNEGYEAETLIKAVKIEGSIQRAARLYHVDTDLIRVALDYERHLNTPPPKVKTKQIAA